MLIVTDETFDTEVLNHEGTVLVYFGASWCSPCVRQLPIVEKFAEESKDVKVVKVDIDESPRTTKESGIRSVPTLIAFENGKEIGMKSGLTNLDKIKEMVSVGL